jgi:hypothetical protein
MGEEDLVISSFYKFRLSEAALLETFFQQKWNVQLDHALCYQREDIHHLHLTL